MSFPFAPVLNVAFFWFPFGDGGKTSEWLQTIRGYEGVKSKLSKVERGRISFTNPDKKRDLQLFNEDAEAPKS